ncbi:MAG: hypothetical protein WDZ62_00660 [Candidatus Pacearchaeota archaeon]
MPNKKKKEEKIIKKKKSSKKGDSDSLKKFLEEAITLTVGRNSEEIVKLLYSKKHVNEFLLAKKLDITINQTRNILYKISDHGLLSSIRKKDKKKGWYTYFWKIEVLKALEFVKTHFLKKKSQVERQINLRETERFYVCKRCNIELTEENALNQDFLCHECGAIFTVKDNRKVLKGMKKNLSKLKENIELIDKEIKKEQERLEKIKIRKYKREQRAKKRKRAAKRAKRKKERAKKKESKSKSKKTSKSTKKKSPKKPKSKSSTKRKTKKVVKKKSKTSKSTKKKKKSSKKSK